MIIAVCGFAGSGKDTFADHLVAHHGFNKIGFAWRLKEAARIIWDFSEEQLFGPSEMREKEDTRYLFSGICPHCQGPCVDLTTDTVDLTKYGANALKKDNAWACLRCAACYKKYLTPRLALQMLGTEYGRTLYKNVWVDACLNYLRNQRGWPNEDWVICDTRFRNEIEGVQDAGGLVVRLLRGEQRFTHASEAELGGIDLEIFDKVLNNEGTLEEFYTTIDTHLPDLRYLVNS